MKLKPIILCGGSGTRLWPASRKSLPKQFLPLFQGKTLLDLTLERVKLFNNFLKPILISSKNHGFHINEALKNNKLEASVLLEPEGKNTTAAIYLAAKCTNKNDVLLIMSADALITDNQYFFKKINEITPIIDDRNWIIFGIVPTYPAEQYGYINIEEMLIKKNPPIYKVKSFIEKPSIKDASSMIKNNTYLWNAGIFMGKASMIIESIKLHAPNIAKACDKVFENLDNSAINDEICFNKELFNDIPSESIDYSVMEKAKNILLSPLNCDWDDVGSWDALSKVDKLNTRSNNVIEISSKDNFIKNDKRVIATIGVENLIIIDSDNATLIAKKGCSEKVKDVVNILKLQNLTEAEEHSFENRPWGKFTNILDTKDCKVKKIEVSPRSRLSLQYHKHRSEHWLVVKGEANIYLDGDLKCLKSGQSIDIPKMSQHYIENKQNETLIIIETQLGDYFGEDDIVRLDDPYNRN